MNENDLRDCFAMFKSITGASADECYMFADEMLASRDKEELRQPVPNTGIIAVRTRRKKND